MSILSLLLISLLLIGTSAICSGLALALMSLDLTDLQRKAKLGDKQAKLVLPLRTNSHLSLVSIVFTNVAVNSATSLVLEERYSGWIAGISSTLLIVIFAEIFPQVVFSRRSLEITAKFVPMIKVMVILTYPFSKPLQFLLDRLFRAIPTRLHTRHELGLIIADHIDDQQSELDESEVDIIRGALALSEKHVRDIMTPVKKTYWLTPDTLINADKIDELKERNFSRIPIFNKTLTECYGLLLMKSLVDVDFDDNPQTVKSLQLHTTQTIGQMTALDTIFRRFISARTHLMPVSQGGKFVGVVTIEDVVEEIIGQEIEDERDTALKNRQKLKARR